MKFASIILAAALLVGCAGMNHPRTFAYPAYGQHAGQQADDHLTCEQWARYRTGYDATGSAVGGAVGGTLIGATIGAIFGAIICAPIGASGDCAAMGAAIGGVQGGVQGAAGSLVGAREEFSQAYGACMAAKGYATGGAYTSGPVGPVVQPVALEPPLPPPPATSPEASPPPPIVVTPPRSPAPSWCRGANQEWLGAACLTRAKEE
jgi:hypothetical protein